MIERRARVSVSSPGTQETTDIRTSELEPRMALVDGKPMQYSPVVHDKPVRSYPAKNGSEVFGTNFLPESISVSPENARWYLALVYGCDIADKMLGQAFTSGEIVSGERFTVADSQARTKGKMSVCTDKSRPGMLVLVPHVLRQSGGKKR